MKTLKFKTMSILSHRGYSIDKKKESAEVVVHHKKQLTVMPHIERQEFAHLSKPIHLYQETDQRLYMPRFYGAKHFGPPDSDKLTTKPFEHSDRLVFKGKLQPHQFAPAEAMQNALDTIGGGVISIACGGGKCLGLDTEVILYSGKIVKVQDIKVGDQLMGDDSTPRTVLSLARGREMMYDIVPTKGEKYTVNESHILSLKYSTTVNKRARKGHVVDMPLKTYLKLPSSYHGRAGPLLGYRVGVNFPEVEVPLDPYFIGLWLGDGNSRQPKITTTNEEIVNYLKSFILTVDPDLDLYQCPDDPITYRIRNLSNVDGDDHNAIMTTLRELNLLQNKHIPEIYKCNSRENRLKLLAGLLDTDGYYHHNMYEIIQKRKQLAHDITFLARSLGFAAYVNECQKTCTNARDGPKVGTYHRVHISGSGLEQIPVLLQYKKAYPRKQIKDALVTRIKAVQTKVDDYYGFEIDGNRRFLLGDFTVTHNTALSIYIACQRKVPFGVVCHTTAMMKQWHERLQQFCPTAKIGIVQQKKCDIEGKDVVIMSVKTVALREFPKDCFARLGLVVWDEIHLMCTQLFSSAFPKLSTKYSIGLSATPFRKDCCDVVFQHHIGPIIFMSKRDRDSTIEARCVTLQMDGIESVHNRFGKIMYTPMAVATVNREERSTFLANMISELGSDGRNVLVLGEYVNHLKTLMKMIKKINPQKPCRPQQIAFMMGWHKRLGAKSELYNRIPKNVGKLIASFMTETVTCGLYIGEMKNEQRKTSESMNIILGTYKLASVGMDIPALNTLVMASPRKEIEQSVGRILRKQKDDAGFSPLIIDIIDDHGVFKAQSRERKKFYKQYGYTVVHTQMLPDGTVLSKRTVKSKDATVKGKVVKGACKVVEDVDDDGSVEEEECMF